MATLLDIVKKGSTDRSVTIRIIDSTDGTPETGVVFDTSGIDLWYRREGGLRVSITEADLATPALDDAHADGGFLHIGDGEYRLDLPDAAFATGANHVDIGGTVTGMVVIGGRVRLVDYNPEDAVRMGMTALPNAEAEAAGGLYTRGTGAGQINQAANGQVDANTVAISGDAAAADNAEADYDGTGFNKAASTIGTAAALTTNNDKSGYSLAADQSGVTIGTVNALATAAIKSIWDQLTSALTTAGSIGKLIVDNLDAVVSAIKAKIDELHDNRITATRAGYLDNINTGGLVASQADVQAITQAQRVRISLPQQLERPDSGSTAYRIWIYVYDELHHAEDLDGLPTVTSENNAGTDRSGNLGTVTKPGATTGQYYVDYTVADSHAIEGLIVKVDATEGAVTTQYAAASIVVDTTAVDFTAADRTKLDALHDTRLTAARAANLDNLDAAVSTRAEASVCTEARLGELDGANLPTDVANVLASVLNQNDLDSTEVQAAAAAALIAIHLDRLLAVTYDPAAKPGVADALLNELVESDAGVSRFTSNALEQGPGGGAGGETRSREGTAQAGGASTITLDSGASAADDYYKHQVLAITGGTGAEQSQIIDSYAGATKVATMAASWATAPDATSTFVILPLGTIPGASAPSAATNAAAVWNKLRADHDAAGSFGEFANDSRAHVRNKKRANRGTGATQVFEDDGSTVRFTRTRQAGPTDEEVDLVTT